MIFVDEWGYEPRSPHFLLQHSNHITLALQNVQFQTPLCFQSEIFGILLGTPWKIKLLAPSIILLFITECCTDRALCMGNFSSFKPCSPSSLLMPVNALIKVTQHKTPFLTWVLLKVAYSRLHFMCCFTSM